MPLLQPRSDVDIHLQHADQFARSGQVAQALALYRTAATVARAQGDTRKAYLAYSALLRLEGPASDAKVHMGECLLELGQAADAARLFDQAGRDLLAQSRVPLAIHALRLAAQADPAPSRWSAYLDTCAQHGGLQEALERAEDHHRTHVSTMDPRSVIELGRLILKYSPGFVPALRRVVRAQLRLGQVHRAVESIREILRVHPTDPDALERMAEAFAALGRTDKAAEVMLRLAHLLLDQGSTSIGETRRVVHRGLLWEPWNAGLSELREMFADRPAAVSREFLAPSPADEPQIEDSRVIYLEDIEEIEPSVVAAPQNLSLGALRQMALRHDPWSRSAARHH